MIEVIFEISSKTLENSEDWLKSLQLPFPLEYWKQKKPHLLANPNVASSSVSLVLFRAEADSTGSALAEAFSAFSPYWKSVEAIIQELNLSFAVVIDLPVKNELPAIRFDVSRDSLAAFPAPFNFSFDIYHLKEFWKPATEEELALIEQMGEDYWHAPMLAELRTEDGTLLTSCETLTQDLDTAVWNALDEWEQSPKTLKTPVEMNVSVPLSVNFFDLAFFLEKETIERLIKMAIGVNLQFIEDEKFRGGPF